MRRKERGAFSCSPPSVPLESNPSRKSVTLISLIYAIGSRPKDRALNRRKASRASLRVHYGFGSPDPAPVFARRSVKLGPESRSRTPRRSALHSRHSSRDVPQPVVDDAAVCRIRFGAGYERALPLSAFSRSGGAFGRVRFAHADGLRLRSFSRGGRSRQVWRGDQFAFG